MYGVVVLDGRQKNKARNILRRWRIRPHSELERSPLTFRFTDREDALLALKAMRYHKVKARLVFQIG